MKIYFDIAFFLTASTLLCGLLALIGKYLPKRWQNSNFRAFCAFFQSIFSVLFVVWLVRSFIVQPYRVPTGSLEPTVRAGDFILVNQFVYGLRMPVLNKKLVSIGLPRRGDIALFRYPVNPGIIYVKRVIGLPGDHIVYRHKKLWINGKEMPQKLTGIELEVSARGIYQPVRVGEERLADVNHQFYIRPGYREMEVIDIVVPPNSYFMMGDNRDNSSDSRSWGVVPEQNLIGKAFAVWMSWDAVKQKVRWNRIGSRVR